MRAGKPVRRSAALRARSASAGSTVARLARLRLRAGPAGGPLGGAHGQPAPDDLAREPAPAVVVRDREHRARVTLGQLAALDEPEHVVRELEQAQPVRDGRLRPCRPARRPRRARARTRRAAPRRRAPPRPPRAPRARRSRRGRAGACRGRRPRARAPARSGSRPPAPRASGARRRSARSRRPARGRTTTGWTRPCARIESASAEVASWSKRFRGWRGFGWIVSTGRCASSGSPGAADQHLEAAAEAAALLRCGRQAPSPPSSTRRRRPSRGRRRSRAGRGSAPRPGAPSAAPTVRKTSSPKCRRTSSLTSAASRVRPSTIVRSTPPSASCGLSRERTSSTEPTSCASPSSA